MIKLLIFLIKLCSNWKCINWQIFILKFEFFINIQNPPNRNRCKTDVNWGFLKSPFILPLLPLEALDLGGAPLRYSEVQGPFLSAKLLLSGLQQQMWSYLVTTKGCRARYSRSCSWDYRTSRFVCENVSKSEFCEVNHSKSTSIGLRDCLECYNSPKNKFKEIGD